jgi:acetyl esterase
MIVPVATSPTKPKRPVPDPDLARLVARLAVDPRPSSIELPLEDGRRNFEAFVRELSAGDPVVSSRDVVIQGPAGRLVVRCYEPPRPAHGALVYLHGGGWVFGSLGSHDGLCRSLARSAGATVVSVEYRLAPEHPFPAALEDVIAAVLWATGRCDSVAVGGDSAGAALALAAAMWSRDEGRRLRGQLLLYPPTRPGGLGGEEPDSPSPAFLTRAEMDWYWSRYLQTDSARVNPLAIPLVGPFNDLPPSYIVVAGLDPLRPEGVDLARRLQEAGVEVALRDYGDMPHGFMLFARELARGRQAIDDAGAAMRELLSPDGAGPSGS